MRLIKPNSIRSQRLPSASIAYRMHMVYYYWWGHQFWCLTVQLSPDRFHFQSVPSERLRSSTWNDVIYEKDYFNIFIWFPENTSAALQLDRCQWIATSTVSIFVEQKSVKWGRIYLGHVQWIRVDFGAWDMCAFTKMMWRKKQSFRFAHIKLSFCARSQQVTMPHCHIASLFHTMRVVKIKLQ